MVRVTYRSLEISHGSTIVTTRLCSPTRRIEGLDTGCENIEERASETTDRRGVGKEIGGSEGHFTEWVKIVGKSGGRVSVECGGVKLEERAGQAVMTPRGMGSYKMSRSLSNGQIDGVWCAVNEGATYPRHQFMALYAQPKELM
jgi:hypothetical protein